MLTVIELEEKPEAIPQDRTSMNGDRARPACRIRSSAPKIFELWQKRMARCFALRRDAPRPSAGRGIKGESEGYHEWLASLFVPLAPLAIAEEHDSSLSLIAAVEAGRGVALIAQGLESLAGPRLKIRALNPAPAPVVVGVAYRKGKISPAAEKFVAALKRPA